MPVDGSLIFNTKIDTDGFSKGEKDISSKALDLKNKISATEAAVKNLREELEKTGNTKVKTKVAESLEKDIAKADTKLQALRQKAIGMYDARVAELRATGLTKGVEDAADRALEQDKAYQKLGKRKEKAEEQLRNYEAELERVTAAAPLEKDTAEYQKKQQRLNELTGQLDVYHAKLREVEQTESDHKQKLQRTISALKLFAKGAAKAGSALKTAFSKTAGKMIQTIGAHFRSTNHSTNILEKSLRRIKNTLIRMFFYRLVHSPLDAVKDGLGEIAKISPEVNRNLSALKTESTYLKNSLAALAAPLVNLVTPAFVSFLQMLSGVTEKAGQLMAVLTGQGYTKAVKVQQDYAASLDDSTKSANANTKALEKNQHALAGFDELNVLTQNDEADSGDTASAVSPFFQNVDAQTAGLSSSLVEALKNQDFEAVGELFGEKINEGLSKIKWDSIKKKAKETASKVTGFINGFLKKTDWKLVGATIGNGIATALIFSNTLFGTLDWSGIGGALHDVIKGALTGENLNLLGNTFAHGVNGLIDLGIALIGDPDFSELGANFEDSLEDTLKSIKWGELSHLFFSFVSGIFEFANGFILEIDWKNFGKDLSKSFADFFGEGGDGRHLLTTIGETVSSFIVGTSDFIIAFFENPKTADDFAGAIEECLSKIEWVKIIIKAITGGIELVAWIIQGVSSLVNKFSKALATGFSDMKDDPELKAAIETLGKAVGNLFIGILNSMFSTLFVAVPNLFVALIKAVLGALSWILKFVLGDDFYQQSMQTLDNWKGFDPKDAPQIPYLATGTVIPANYGEFLAVLGDNKREAEVVSPVSAMKQAFLEALAEGNFSGGDGDKVINLHIDGSRFFTWIIGKNNEYQKAHGYSALAGGEQL